MEIEHVLARLQSVVDKHGSQVAAAKTLGVSNSYLADVLSRRREPGKKVLQALGLARVTTYRRDL